MSIDRRKFVRQTTALVGAAALPACLPSMAHAAPGEQCRLGLVTYLWGQHLTLPELIAAGEYSGILGLELRTTHKHGVERDLNANERRAVKARLADSPVSLVSLGSNERYDDPNPAKVKAAVAATRDFIDLSRDVGSSGVKVKGDRFYDNVPRQQTLDQVGAALRELGEYAADHGQEIRLEVHGGFSQLPVHHEILHAADHPHVKSCWNSNQQDLEGAGLKANFDLVKDHFGKTAHIRALENNNYPFEELIGLFVGMDYDGWLLLEARGDVKPDEVPEKLKHQKAVFDRYVATAQRKLSG